MLVAEFVHTELLLADKKLLVTSSYNMVIIQALHQTCKQIEAFKTAINYKYLDCAAGAGRSNNKKVANIGHKFKIKPCDVTK